MEAIELGFDTLVRLCILLIELAGIIVIVISMVRGFIGFVQKDDSTRIQLAQGIMLGLEFKVGSEVLRSVIVSGWNELGTLAAVILLRSLLTLLLHWRSTWRKSVSANARRPKRSRPRNCPKPERRALKEAFDDERFPSPRRTKSHTFFARAAHTACADGALPGLGSADTCAASCHVVLRLPHP